MTAEPRTANGWRNEHDALLKKCYREGWANLETAYRLFVAFGIQRTSSAVGQRVAALLKVKEMKAKPKKAVKATQEAMDHMSRVEGRKFNPSPMLKVVEAKVKKTKVKKPKKSKKTGAITGFRKHPAAEGGSATAIFTLMARDYPDVFDLLGEFLLKSAEEEKKTIFDLAQDVLYVRAHRKAG